MTGIRSRLASRQVPPAGRAPVPCRLSFMLATLIWFGGAAACGGAGGAGQKAASGGVTVGTVVATLAPLEVTLRETGTVVARPGGFAAVSVPAPARVIAIYVEPGQRVASGAALVAVDASPFRAALREAEAAQQTARLAAERASRLAADGIAPRRDVEQTRAALAQADAVLVVARRNMVRSTLRAPIAGIVSRVTAVLDATADPAQTLVEVVDPTALQVRVMVAPADAGAVRVGAPVTFTAPGGDSLGNGVVTTIAPSVDATSGAVEVRVRVTNAARTLRVGEALTADVLLARPGVPKVVVPVSALVPETDGYRVYVVDRGDTARARTVTIGRRTTQLVEIATGVAAGETVVSEGAYGVEDGVHVIRAAVDSVRGRTSPAPATVPPKGRP